MAIMYPIYKDFNNLIFGGDILDFRSDPWRNAKKSIFQFKKDLEFRTRLPKDLKTGDKIYIYEPKKHGGSGKVVGEFTVGEIIPCDYPFGAYPFIVHFCRNVLKNEDYVKKFERAVKADLPGYKKGCVLKYALDDESMDGIEKTCKPPEIASYLYDKKRCENLDESERIWKWCDSWLSAIGFYDNTGESNYKFAIEIRNPIQYNEPKVLCDFVKLDGSIVTSAPQSYIYVKEN